MTRTTKLTASLAALAATGALAAAGTAIGDGDVRASAVSLRLSADPAGALEFDKSRLVAKRPGKVVISFSNPADAGVEHAVAVRGRGIAPKSSKIVEPGEDTRVAVRLKPGRYVFFCPVEGHEEGGMKGRLTVRRP